VVVEHGIRDASVDAIAARAHAGKDTIYRRWPHKDQLIRAALEHALDADLGVPRSGVVADDLVRYLEALDRLLIAGTTGTIVRELVAEAPRDPLVGMWLAAFRDRHLAALVHILSGHPAIGTREHARVLAELALGWAVGRRLLEDITDTPPPNERLRLTVEGLLDPLDAGPMPAPGPSAGRVPVTRSGPRRSD
jgi:AcrR family transcriptional regulator